MNMRLVTCVGINGEKTEVPVDQLEFRPSVYGVIVRDGKVLLSSQWDGWDFPGGGIELGETMDEALIREIKEETGLAATRGELLHVAESFFTHPNTMKHCHTLLVYYACAAEGDISVKNLSEEEKLYVREAQWIPVDAISTLKFYNQVDSAALIKMASDK